MTRNEYVRCELSRLQAQLQNLEKRAVEIESDIRHSMATGQTPHIEYVCMLDP